MKRTVHPGSAQLSQLDLFSDAPEAAREPAPLPDTSKTIETAYDIRDDSGPAHFADPKGEISAMQPAQAEGDADVTESKSAGSTAGPSPAPSIQADMVIEVIPPGKRQSLHKVKQGGVDIGGFRVYGTRIEYPPGTAHPEVVKVAEKLVAEKRAAQKAQDEADERAYQERLAAEKVNETPAIPLLTGEALLIKAAEYWAEMSPTGRNTSLLAQGLNEFDAMEGRFFAWDNLDSALREGLAARFARRENWTARAPKNANSSLQLFDAVVQPEQGVSVAPVVLREESERLTDTVAGGVVTIPPKADSAQAEPIVMDEETYLSVNGAGRGKIGDAGLHRSSERKSEKTHRRQVDEQAQRDHEVIARRGELREEYRAKVAAGEIRPPSAKEEVIAKANGHPDNAATQAARRIADRRGWQWQQDEPDAEMSQAALSVNQETLETSHLPAPEMPAQGERREPSSIEREQSRPSSWVIRNKDSGAVIMETSSDEKVAALNTAKYEAVPILQHLQELNDPSSKARQAAEYSAYRKDRKEAAQKSVERSAPATEEVPFTLRLHRDFMQHHVQILAELERRGLMDALRKQASLRDISKWDSKTIASKSDDYVRLVQSGVAPIEVGESVPEVRDGAALQSLLATNPTVDDWIRDRVEFTRGGKWSSPDFPGKVFSQRDDKPEHFYSQLFGTSTGLTEEQITGYAERLGNTPDNVRRIVAFQAAQGVSDVVGYLEESIRTKAENEARSIREREELASLTGRIVVRGDKAYRLEPISTDRRVRHGLPVVPVKEFPTQKTDLWEHYLGHPDSQFVKSLLKEALAQPAPAPQQAPVPEGPVGREPVVMGEEAYLAAQGAGRGAMGDAGLHKRGRNQSNNVWGGMVRQQAAKDAKVVARREILRDDYAHLVSEGQLRPPTRQEKIIATANGHPDNEAVQAARRIASENGWDWQRTEAALNSDVVQEGCQGAVGEHSPDTSDSADETLSSSMRRRRP
jgi:hypothetical protein